METTIAVMLYLGVMCSPCEYEAEEVYELEDANYGEIQAVMDDDEKMNTVEDDFYPQVDEVYIYEEEGEDVVVVEPDEMD